MSDDPEPNPWYLHFEDVYPDLEPGHCPHCGDHEMIIVYEDGATECYHCGDSEGVTIDV